MEKIFITTQTGQKVEVGVVRLFKHNDTVFFIYTLSEKDVNNYVKLYVTKINMGNLQSVVITDENEWTSFKEIMKTIIKNNRNNAPLEIIDLDSKTIENITVYDPKVFKLSEEMTNFLQMNIKLANNISEVAPLEPQSTVPDVFASPVTNNSVDVEPNVNNTVVDVSSLSGDISASPEPAGVVNEIPNISVEQPVIDVNVTENVVPETNVTDEINVSQELPSVNSEVVMPDSNTSIEVPTPVMPVPDNSSLANVEVDYKVAYLEEQLKVETLNTKIATLEAQIKLLEQKIEQIKNVIE